MVASSTLRRIPVALERNPYEVVIGAGGLTGIGAELKQAGIREGRRILVVSNADVAGPTGRPVSRACAAADSAPSCW